MYSKYSILNSSSGTIQCSLGLVDCGPNSVCNGGEDGYRCRCLEGFVEVDGQCVIPLYTQCYNITCGDNALCVIVGGSAVCECYEGFYGDGYSCIGE